MYRKRLVLPVIGASLFSLLLNGTGSPLAGAELPDTVNVSLLEAYPQISSIRVEGPLQIISPVSRRLGGQAYQATTRNGLIVIRPTATAKAVFQAPRVILKHPQGKPIAVQAQTLAVRKYPGQLSLRANAKGKLQIVNRLGARRYVALVVASETLPGWPEEALKAQAVLTQTHLSRYRNGDALGDSTQQEAYLGSTHQRAEVDRAVNAVWGETLTYRGQPITPFYHAGCAGHTSDGHYFNPQKNPPWLSAIRCSYCRNAPFFKPTQTTIPQSAFEHAFGAGPPRILQRDETGRPISIHSGNGQAMTGYAFWLKLGQRFGWGKAPGTRFSIRQLPNGDYAVRSTGAGHGVGLCQWGAAGMARAGKSYRDILHFYFPNTQLTGPHTSQAAPSRQAF